MTWALFTRKIYSSCQNHSY